eukprot:3809584-Pyramimonas_sp.AAC.1
MGAAARVALARERHILAGEGTRKASAWSFGAVGEAHGAWRLLARVRAAQAEWRSSFGTSRAPAAI